jgi:hypothetical protein
MLYSGNQIQLVHFNNPPFSNKGVVHSRILFERFYPVTLLSSLRYVRHLLPLSTMLILIQLVNYLYNDINSALYDFKLILDNHLVLKL